MAAEDDYAVAAVRDALKDEDRPADGTSLEKTFRTRARSIMSQVSSDTKRRIVMSVVAAALTLVLAFTMRPPLLKEDRPNGDPVDAPLSIRYVLMAAAGAGVGTFVLAWFMRSGRIW